MIIIVNISIIMTIIISIIVIIVMVILAMITPARRRLAGCNCAGRSQKCGPGVVICMYVCMYIYIYIYL